MIRFKPGQPRDPRVKTVDSVSREVTETQAALAEVYEAQAGTADELTEAQAAIAEMYETVSAQLGEIQMALAEIYEAGGAN